MTVMPSICFGLNHSPTAATMGLPEIAGLGSVTLANDVRLAMGTGFAATGLAGDARRAAGRWPLAAGRASTYRNTY